MKNNIIFCLEIIFTFNLLYFSSIKAIPIHTNQQIVSLIDNYVQNKRENHLSSQFVEYEYHNHTNNLTYNFTVNDNTNVKNNSKNIDENKKIKDFNFNPFFEGSLEDIKLISSKFLGMIVPNSQEETLKDEKLKKSKINEIDCKNFEKLSKENFEVFKNNCKIRNLIDFKTNLITDLNRNIDNKHITLETTKMYTNLLTLFQTERILECNNETCKPGQGSCTTDSKCVCETGFVDDPNLKINKYCSYKQKRQLIFFLIEFFAPFGIGHILNGRFIYGVIKCSVVLGLILLDLFSKCILLCGKDRGAKCPNYITFLYYGIIIFWQAFDITMIGFNKFREENNIPYIQVEF